MITIENEIRLRKPEMKDLETLYWMKNDHEIGLQLGGFSTAYSRMDIENWIKFHNDKKDELLWVIEHITDDVVIGHVGLYNIDTRIRKAEFAIMIGNNNYLGKGIGSKVSSAFIDYGVKMFNLHKITLEVFTDNKRAISTYEKNDFLKVGIMKDNQYKNGRYIDVMIMEKLFD